MPSDRPKYQFGPFELDVAEGTLARNGNRVKLQDLPCRLLIMLVERPGEVVSRDEIRQRIWSAGHLLEFDNSLGVAIRKIRDALGDNPEAPRYLETVPRRGYRFSAPGYKLNGSGFAVQVWTSVSETREKLEGALRTIESKIVIGELYWSLRPRSFPRFTGSAAQKCSVPTLPVHSHDASD